MISRYTREEMGRVWSEEGKFKRWLEVELAATETLAESGVVPAAAAAKIREKARVDANMVRRIVALVPVETAEAQKAQNQVIFLENLFDELRRKIPVGI